MAGWRWCAVLLVPSLGIACGGETAIEPVDGGTTTGVVIQSASIAVRADSVTYDLNW